MLRVLGFFLLICATCRAVPTTLPGSVTCGEVPRGILSCANLPRYYISEQPKHQTNCSTGSPRELTCEKVTCGFRESGFIVGTSLNYTKMSEKLDQSASDFPVWTAAIQQAKKTCLAKNLHVNIYNINCLPYDIMFCTFATVIKNTPPASWSSAPNCEYSRRYAETCPECPECFARAMYALPR